MVVSAEFGGDCVDLGKRSEMRLRSLRSALVQSRTGSKKSCERAGREPQEGRFSRIISSGSKDYRKLSIPSRSILSVCSADTGSRTGARTWAKPLSGPRLTSASPWKTRVLCWLQRYCSGSGGRVEPEKRARKRYLITWSFCFDRCTCYQDAIIVM